MADASPTSSSQPYLLEVRSSKKFILTTVCAAIFTDSFLYSVLVPVIPFSLRDRSDVPEQDVQWWASFLLAGYGLMVLIGSPISGYYADHTTNRRVPFFLGLFALMAGIILFGIATSVWVMVLSRLLQGLSAAVVYSVGLAVLTDTVGREEIGIWMGTALSSNSIGLVIAPLLGGLVYRKLGYGAVLGMALVVIGVDVVLRVMMVERKTAESYYRVCEDVKDSDAASYGTFRETGDQRTCLPDKYPKSSDSMVSKRSERCSFSSTSPVSVGGRYAREHSKLPTILVLLSSPRLLASLYGSFVNFTILASFDGVLPLFVERTFNWTSLGAGLIFLTLAIPALAGPIVGRASDRFGRRWIAGAGCLLTAPSLVLLKLIDHNSLEQVVMFCGLLTLLGCTLILIISPLAADLSFVAEEKARLNPLVFGPGGAYAQVYSLFNCSMAAGVLTGPVVAGWLADEYGWSTMACVMGLLSLSGALPCMVFTGGPVIIKKWKSEGKYSQDADGQASSSGCVVPLIQGNEPTR